MDYTFSVDICVVVVEVGHWCCDICAEMIIDTEV